MPTNKEREVSGYPVLDLTLCCRWTQRLYFSAYEKVSEANNILHTICPNLVTRKEGINKAVVAERFAEIIQRLDATCNEVDQNLDKLLGFISEKLESEGIDPNPIVTRYAGVLNKRVLVNTPADARFLTLLKKTDRGMSFLTAAFLCHVYSTTEYARSDQDLRNWMNLLYRAHKHCCLEASALMEIGRTTTMHLETYRTHSHLKATA